LKFIFNTSTTISSFRRRAIRRQEYGESSVGFGGERPKSSER